MEVWTAEPSHPSGARKMRRSKGSLAAWRTLPRMSAWEGHHLIESRADKREGAWGSRNEFILFLSNAESEDQKEDTLASIGLLILRIKQTENKTTERGNHEKDEQR